MSDQPKPTHTLILALALRVIADDLYGDGATVAAVAAVALTDAAARLATLERKCMAMDQALRQIANSGKRGTRDRRNARAALSFVDSLMMNDAAPAPCVWRQDLDAGMWRQAVQRRVDPGHRPTVPRGWCAVLREAVGSKAI